MCNLIMFCQNNKTGGKGKMKEGKKLEERVLSVVEKMSRNEIIKNLYGWPPHCMGIYHQPKRPKRKEN